jgi:UPF0716 protein FxsA
MRALALVALFILVPIAELAVIIQVGGEIGVLPTVALLVLDSVLGSLLLRSQGRTVWRRFSDALARGRVPHREILDGVLVIFGGALLLTPGFLTDVLGLLLLVPATRAVARRVLVRAAGRRVIVGVAGGRRARPFDVDGTARAPGGPTRPADVDGTAHEHSPSASDPHRLER